MVKYFPICCIEFNIFLVECFDWSSYIEDDHCLKESLINNHWALEEELKDLQEAELKEILIKNLNFYYDDTIHSSTDLNLREVSGKKGSLCGMAAVYQAAVQTIMTVSELKLLSYDDVKFKVASEIGYDAVSSKKASDVDLLNEFFQHACNGVSRKKRHSFSLKSLPNQREKREEPETLMELEMRSSGSRLRYECGIARKFLDPETGDTYDERWMTCNWNKTWTLVDSLDDCIWVQCLYPPEPPPNTHLSLTWNGEPVDFHDNASYVCTDEDTYFEVDKEMLEYNISCMPGGSWNTPDIWPICLNCKYLYIYWILLKD